MPRELPNEPYLSDSALHNDEVRVVYVELNRLEEGEDILLLCFMSIEKVFRYVREGNLARKC